MFARRRRAASIAGFAGCSWYPPALYSLGHGGNDAQKTMGIIWMLLIAGGSRASDRRLPLWVVIRVLRRDALGTLFGGWRIVKTMGQRITKLKPVERLLR